MIGYYDLPPSLMALFLTVIFLTLCVSILCLILEIQKRRIRTGVLMSFCAVLSFSMLVVYSSNMKASLLQRTAPQWVVDLSNLPIAAACLLLLGILAAEAMILVCDLRYRKHTITHASIKESLDHLTTGLCFAKPGGMVMLINHRMNRLGFAIAGEEIQNAAWFWETLQRGEERTDARCITGGEIPEYRLPDGSIWTFRRELLEDAVQITAADTTELHQTMEQLREENRRLAAMCQRIGDYGDKVDQYVIARERLETRVNLHSFLGQALLTTRHYLQYHSGDPRKILAMWQRNIDVLKLEAEPQQEPDSFRELQANAEIVGIRVTITGVVPAEPEVKRLLAAIGVEAVINAGKHAEAKRLQIEISEEDGRYLARYRNDGKAPSGPVAEGGGLGSLQARVERAGGKMEIVSQPEFVLTVRLGKEVSPI
ncbi:MAG: hypothetical protein IJF59_02115 [Clostridia bacterium]|nr:hypothetical protein [Clostridia bacterium]MBQ3077903.1 hypothetical protein [Clostridia bacterium]